MAMKIIHWQNDFYNMWWVLGAIACLCLVGRKPHPTGARRLVRIEIGEMTDRGYPFTYINDDGSQTVVYLNEQQALENIRKAREAGVEIVEYAFGEETYLSDNNEENNIEPIKRKELR